MRVLHVISGIEPENGGPTTALIGLTKAQKQLGLDVRVVSTYRRPSGPANVPAFTANGVPVEMIGPGWTRRLWHPRMRATLRRLIAPVDVVHIHALFEEIQHQAATLARELGKPYIMRPCGALDPWVQSRGRLKKWLYMALRLRRDLNCAAAVHYVTAAERDAAAPIGLTSRAIVEPNGIDLAEFDPLPPRGLFRARFPQLKDKRIVLFLGRIDYKKGLDLLIPAFAQARLPDTVLVLAGPDSHGYTSQMQALVVTEKLTDRVLFTGMLRGAERIEALVDADLFAMTSYVENFGVSVVEAMAAGVPVLVSPGVNLASELPATVGQVVHGNDPDAWARSLGDWLLDPHRCQSAGAAGRFYALDRYDWQKIASRWADHYAEHASRVRQRLAASPSCG